MKNNMWKKGLVLGIIVLFVGVSVYPSITGEILDTQWSRKNEMYNNKLDSSAYYFIEENETIYDGTGDVVNLTGEIVEEHPYIDVENIDITKLTYYRVDKNVSVTVDVWGLIENRGNMKDMCIFWYGGGPPLDIDTVAYWFTLTTSYESYQIAYINKKCQLMYVNTSELRNLSDDDFSVSDNTLSVTFNLLTADEIYETISVDTIYAKIYWEDEQNPPEEWFYLFDEAPNQPLESYAVGPNFGIVRKEINFEGFALYGQPPYTYHWDFGDGKSSTEKNPTHVYNKAGEYIYNFTVTDDSGSSCSDTGEIKIIGYTFIVGRITNLITTGEYITFEAVNIRTMTLFPPTFNHYTSGEMLTISQQYLGIITLRFIFAFCGLSYESSTISMNKFSQDDSANTVIWLVSGVEGNPLRTKDVETMLLNESGEPQPDAEITFNEATGEGYINPGDTFTVVAPSDGYYVFMLTHKISGATIYKGSLTHY